MPNLFATFKLVDEISANLERIANKGMDGIKQLDNIGVTASTSFQKAESGALQTAQAVNGVATSISIVKSGSDDLSIALDKEATKMKNASDKAQIKAGLDKRLAERAREYYEKIKLATDENGKLTEELKETSRAALIEAERLEKAAIASANKAEKTALSAKVTRENAEEMINSSIATADLAKNSKILENALDNQAKTADHVADSIDDYGDEVDTAGEKSKEFGHKSTNAIGDLSNVLAAAGVAQTLKSIYDAFMSCNMAAMEFEVTTAGIATVADTTKTSISSVSKAILDLSNDTGKVADNLSDAVYQAISAGVDTNEAVAFSGTATKLASGGFTEAATAVDVLTTALNAYGLETEKADKISDMLITTQNLGKTTVNELASSVGNVIPLASAFGVEMDNLSTAYAQLTAGGIATSEAGTYIKSMLNELGTSSSKVAKTIQNETGESFASLMEQGYSLGDVLDILGGSVDGDTTKFNELWSSTEAGVGALALFNSGSVAFNGTLEKMQNSTGATAKASDIMSNTTAHSLEKMQNASTNMSIVIGSQLNPTLKQLYNVGASAFTWIGDFLEENPAVTAALVGTAVSVGVVAMAFTGFALVTSPTVVTAITAITAAMMANPIFLAVTAVVALTAATVAFVAILANQETEYESWTHSTRKQYDELETLNTEYDKACEQYGETSKEASLLRYEVDELNESLNNNKQTVEEFLAECDALAESHDKLVSTYRDTTKEIRNEELGTFALIQKLDDLASSTDKTAGSSEQMKAIISDLNKTLPDLALTYEDVTTNSDKMVESLKKAAAEKAKQLNSEAKYDAYTGALREQDTLIQQIAQAEFDLEEERQNARENAWLQTSNTSDLFVQMFTDCDEYEKALKELQDKQKEGLDLMAETEKGWEAEAEAIKNAEKAGISYEDAVKTALDTVEIEIDGVKVKVEEMAKAYDEAYEAARTSLDGTVGLFEKAEVKAGVSSKNIIEAWQTQIDFFKEYDENLQALEKHGLNSDLVIKLSDGSAESINQVKTLADELDKLDSKGAKKTIDNINKKFEELSTAKDTASTTMADIQTDFSNNLDIMKNNLIDTIDKMNMEDGAKEAAKKTMDGYINSIKNSQKGAVSTALAVSSAVSAALDGTYEVEKDKANPFIPIKPYIPYAKGTSSAKTGLALVGEEGPELINFSGGEVVYTADKTSKIMNNISDNTFKTPIPSNTDSYENSPLSEDKKANTAEKKITFEIVGSGEMNINGETSEDTILQTLINNIKPVLMNIIKQEIYEEGDFAYDF